MSFGTYSIATEAYGGGTGGSSIMYYSVALVDPADGASLSGAKPTFTATPYSSDGSNAHIEWQWDTASTFTNPDTRQQTKVTSGNTSGVNASTTPDFAMVTDTWYWRVRAGDGSSTWSDYSATYSLTVDSPVAMTNTTYMYENVGLAPASPEETEDGHLYMYENVGFAPAAQEDTEDGLLYMYENIQSRPAGSKEALPPTHN